MSSVYLPRARYVAALERIRKLILKDVPLRAVDDTTPGDKSTTCTWGLCSDAKDAWPDAEDHLFPEDFTKYGRVAPKYLRSTWLCPIDARDPSKTRSDLNGCFATCRVFQSKKRPTQGQVIDWYDLRIAQFKEKQKL